MSDLIERLEGNNAYCSFCGKSKTEVQKLIAGPAAWICNECVDLMYEHMLHAEDTPK